MHERLKIATERASEALLRRGWKIATAESCTGGMLAMQLTEISGSSVWFERGFVTYSNEAKNELLGVPLATIEEHGAVSQAAALAMANGALERSRADVTVAITGIAGPTGAVPNKPVGTVWFATAMRGEAARAVLRQFNGDRAEIRAQATVFALDEIARLANEPSANLA
ncbi:MAG TPA: CinA family protein [Burkholderiaceae bacterium]|nr:CinA family protein [Burkholderiaceae bacterium]